MSLNSEILNDHKFKFSKKLGQNFLIDNNIIRKIINAAKLNNSQFVLEIGSGAGALTKELLKSSKLVVSIEIDTKLVKILENSFKYFDNLKIINNDILKVNMKKIVEENFKSQNFVLIGNLPYYITTAIILKILKQKLNFERAIFMIQKEVALKLTTKSGKSYGSLSILTSYYCNAKILFDVSPACFMPKPSVTSTIVEITRNYEFENFEYEELFLKIVRTSFLYRRKKLTSSIQKEMHINKLILENILKTMNFTPNVRAEELSVSDFILLTSKISETL